jgi:hypothetical protein
MPQMSNLMNQQGFQNKLLPTKCHPLQLQSLFYGWGKQYGVEAQFNPPDAALDSSPGTIVPPTAPPLSRGPSRFAPSSRPPFQRSTSTVAVHQLAAAAEPESDTDPMADDDAFDISYIRAIEMSDADFNEYEALWIRAVDSQQRTNHCFWCKNTEHMLADCPELKAKDSFQLKVISREIVRHLKDKVRATKTPDF